MVLTTLDVAIWAYGQQRPVTAADVEKEFGVSRSRANEVMRYLRQSTRYELREIQISLAGRETTAYEVLSVKLRTNKDDGRILQKGKKVPRPEYSPLLAMALGIKRES